VRRAEYSFVYLTDELTVITCFCERSFHWFWSTWHRSISWRKLSAATQET